MRLRPLLVVVLALSLKGAATAQPTTPEETRAFLLQEMADAHIPGLVAYVSKSGAVVYHEALGLADVGANRPMTRETVTILASVSKPFTAAALLTLHDQGRFALDDPINAHLPFQVVHPDFPNEDITFRMLLTHQSGIVDNPTVETETDGDSPVALGDFIRDLLVEGGAYYSAETFGPEPGTEYRYSNDGVALMGYLVEAISGTTFQDYSQSALFGPLGMTRTSWFLSGVDTEPLARPHVWQADAQSYQTLPQPGFADYPAGQLRTTAAQVGRFLQMFHNGGTLDGRRVLAAATAAAMVSPQVQDIDDDGTDSGFIWYSATRGGQTAWEHNGSILGIATVASMLPDQDISVVVLANGEVGSLDRIQEALTAYALQSSVAAEPPAAAPAGYAIEAVGPNPVARRGTVRFRVPEASRATVEVYDALGRHVATLFDGTASAGTHRAPWPVAGLPSGTYLVRLRAGDAVVSRSVTVAGR